MYNSHFGFVRKPFASVPEVDQYFPGSTIEDARTILVRCLQRGEGHAMVIGASGIGKTLLCRLLAKQFEDSFQVALLASGRLSSRRNLFQAILYELSRPYRAMDEGELRLSLVDYLTRSDECPRGMVLLVDEAHTLPLRLLDELRMLTNIARDGEPAVRLVLAGGSVLEERFASPKLDSFNQRLIARCYLEALNRTETQDYIHRQIGLARGELSPSSSVGATDSSSGVQRGNGLFSVDACRSVHEVADGVPRLINQVCDHALLLAYADGREQISSADVDEAWADLQQLPTPWNEESCDNGDNSVIEFGGLDDTTDDLVHDAVHDTTAGATDDSEILNDDILTDDEILNDDEQAAPSLRISPDMEEGSFPEAAEVDAVKFNAVEPAVQLQRIEQLLSDAEEEFRPAGSIRPEIELVFVDPFEEEFDEEEVVVDRYDSPAVAEQEETLLQDTEALVTQIGAENSKDASLSKNQEEATKRTGEEPRDEDILVVDESGTGTRPIIAVRRHEFGQLFAKLRRG
ncbi:MAG TPA: AAA family ATPase [Thermoguttaceae bacterium]|nr:AAA family ATPase [Thermoguttaceae bacterium]